MNYILKLLPVFPIGVAITAILYFFVNKVVKKERQKLSKMEGLAEFALIGWGIMFLYITQVMSFGNGMGEGINLQPLHPFYISAKYGLKNAEMVEQLLLNTVMLVPLGFLLPVVFPKKCRNYFTIFLISFCVTLLTEISQLIAERSADIDDIITNTLGGLLGFALYVFGCGIYFRAKGRKIGNILNINHYCIQLIVSFILLILTVSPFVVVKIINDSNEVGYVYYGHFQPSNVEIADTVSDKETTAMVYKYSEKEIVEKLEERLTKGSGFTGSFVNGGDCLKLKNSENERIFIFNYNKWSIYYNYGEDKSTDVSKLPNEKEAISLAIKNLEKFGIPEDTIEFKEISNDYGDKNLHLVFSGKNIFGDEVVFGEVRVTLGENGKLLDITDSRVNCKFYKKVETISPRQSISISQDVGVGIWNMTAYVERVKPDFYFNEDTGFLIPTWKISGFYNDKNSNKESWTPNMDARK